MKYQVVMKDEFGFWVNCWHDDEDGKPKPSLFNSIDEAEYEIAECLELCEQAGMEGYSRDDYKIEEVEQ